MRTINIIQDEEEKALSNLVLLTKENLELEDDITTLQNKLTIIQELEKEGVFQ